MLRPWTCTSLPLLAVLLCWLLTGCTAPVPSVDSAAIFARSVCMSCVSTACQKELLACGTDPQCSAQFSCIGHCQTAPNGNADMQCEQSCLAENPIESESGQAAGDAMRRCRYEGPGLQCSACGIPGPSDGEGNPLFHQPCAEREDPQQTCQECGRAVCCDSYREFEQTAASYNYGLCVYNCPANPKDDYGQPFDPVKAQQRVMCLQNCQRVYESGRLIFERNLLCMLHNCPRACGVTLSSGTACWLEKCLKSVLACKTNLDCLKIDDCTTNCAESGIEDTICSSNCYQASPAGQERYSTMSLCMIRTC